MSSTKTTSSSSEMKIDFSLLPENVPAVCVPYVFENIHEARIRAIFKELDVGEVSQVDLIPYTASDGKRVNRVFIHLKWNTKESTNKVRTKLLCGREIKVVYEDPWFWCVSASRATKAPPREKKTTTRDKPRPRIEDDDDNEKKPKITKALRANQPRPQLNVEVSNHQQVAPRLPVAPSLPVETRLPIAPVLQDVSNFTPTPTIDSTNIDSTNIDPTNIDPNLPQQRFPNERRLRVNLTSESECPINSEEVEYDDSCCQDNDRDDISTITDGSTQSKPRKNNYLDVDDMQRDERSVSYSKVPMVPPVKLKKKRVVKKKLLDDDGSTATTTTATTTSENA